MNWKQVTRVCPECGTEYSLARSCPHCGNEYNYYDPAPVAPGSKRGGIFLHQHPGRDHVMFFADPAEIKQFNARRPPDEQAVERPLDEQAISAIRLLSITKRLSDGKFMTMYVGQEFPESAIAEATEMLCAGAPEDTSRGMWDKVHIVRDDL